jgi:hypothetical protein
VNYFPQTGAGSIAQFPVQRTRQWRWISNQMESGEMVQLPDTPASRIAWSLKYMDVTAAEAARFSTLFATCFGQYGAFIFVDPMANLLAWSEDFSRPDWQPGLLSTSAGAADPIGTQRASTVMNSAAAEQALTQALDLPGDYVACLSVWARSDSGGSFALVRDGARSNVQLTPSWTRYNISGKGTAGAAMGIYLETYFASDEMAMTNTAPGLFAFEIDLISRVQS